MSTGTSHAVTTGPGPRPYDAWRRDLWLGARFAVSGRESWYRTVLTGFGVGCAVALLMLATAVPGMLAARDNRGAQRDLSYYGDPIAASASTLVVRDVNDTFHDEPIHGEVVRPDGPDVPTPPGLAAWPSGGTMYVSPALRELLASPDGALLRERLPYRDVGTVGDAGLVGPGELVYYAGDASLPSPEGNSGRPGSDYRTNSIGGHLISDALSPMMMLLTLVTFVVLLIPVAVFVATSVRIGGERRDRRLAALRLVGADILGTHRVAAGESLVGAALGVPIGLLVFATGRELIAAVDLLGVSVFPSDISPPLWLVGLIVAAVPGCAVLVTMLSLRGVSIEPLGVVRGGAAPKRRLWWRLFAPVIGALLLATTTVGNEFSSSNQNRLITGVTLLLVGVVMVLPWVIERVVARISGGPVPLQLGNGWLRLSGGSAARAVSGVTVAVAGAIALQSLFGGAGGQFTRSTGVDLTRAQASVDGSTDTATAARLKAGLRATPGVTVVAALFDSFQVRGLSDQTLPISIGDCAALAEYSGVTDCTPGGAYWVQDPQTAELTGPPPIGQRLNLNTESEGKPSYWTVPKGVRTVPARSGPEGWARAGLFLTPQVLDPSRLPAPELTASLRFAPGDRDAIERARNAVAKLAPGLSLNPYQIKVTDRKFANLQRGLLVGAAVTLLLIAIGIAVSTTEQLRERRRLLAVLVAFGTKRSTLALSVLWQSAVPVALGLTLALACGLGLGALLMGLSSQPIHFDWPAITALLTAGAAAIAVATALSLPLLWRLMRPEGLRTE